MSVGVPTSYSALNSAVQSAATNYSVVLVTSTGNTGNGVQAPASFNNVIGVSATNSNNQLASWPNGSGGTNYANQTNADIYAPGRDIAVATLPPDKRYPGYPTSQPDPRQFYFSPGGTSFSAPMVAGIVACLFQRGYAWNYITALNRLQTRGYWNAAVGGYNLNALNTVKP